MSVDLLLTREATGWMVTVPGARSAFYAVHGEIPEEPPRDVVTGACCMAREAGCTNVVVKTSRGEYSINPEVWLREIEDGER